MMKELLSDYCDTVAKALAGRSMAGVATSNGLPGDAIRYVIQGRDPKLSRADAICRALDCSFTIGASSDVKSTFDLSTALSEIEAGFNAPVSDAELTLLLTRLADLWQIIGARERKYLTLAIVNILELTHVTNKDRVG